MPTLTGQNPAVVAEIRGDASSLNRAVDSGRAGLLGLKKAALAAGGVLAGALAVRGLGAAVDAARSFEQAMVEVQKVTDPETAAALGDAMRDLATQIPVAQEELAALAADAARFGVRGTENIQNFVEATSKMATATDLSTNEAGEAFARLAQLTDTPIDQIENLGSAINTLSNNMATSSGEIVDSMLRSSAAMNQFGLNNREIVAFSAALNEVSESSERAGTRLRRLAQELLNPKKVSDIAGALGMTTDEFRRMRREDPDGLMLQIVEAFAEGGEQAENLRSNLGSATRQAVSGLAQNLEGLREALEQSNTSFEEGSSLQEEFDAATKTFNARLQVLKNNLNEVAITVGNELLPELNPLVKNINDLLSGAKDLNAVVGDETASNLASVGAEFRKMVDPVKTIAEESLTIARRLLFLSEKVAPSLIPILRDTRFVLEGIGGAMEFVNDQTDALIRKWKSLPKPFRENLIALAQLTGGGRLPPGPFPGITMGADLVRQNRLLRERRRQRAREAQVAAAGSTRDMTGRGPPARSIEINGRLTTEEGEVVALIDERVDRNRTNESARVRRNVGGP